MVNELLLQGHDITIATRGKTMDCYGNKVKRITFERTNEHSVRNALLGTHYDVVIDKVVYCSNDIKYIMDVIDCDKYIYMSSTAVYNPLHWNIEEKDFDAVSKKLVWCERKEYPYAEIKRQAEPVPYNHGNKASRIIHRQYISFIVTRLPTIVIHSQNMHS
jgi:hypothetical protein